MRILIKSLNIKFYNTNTNEQIVQAKARVLAYNLSENDEKIKFYYNFKNSHCIEDEIEI